MNLFFSVFYAVCFFLCGYSQIFTLIYTRTKFNTLNVVRGIMWLALSGMFMVLIVVSRSRERPHTILFHFALQRIFQSIVEIGQLFLI